MRDTDRKEFACLFAGVCANYGRDLTKELLDVWWSQLRDQNFAAVSEAVIMHLRTSKYMPTVHEILVLVQHGAGVIRRANAVVPNSLPRPPMSEEAAAAVRKMLEDTRRMLASIDDDKDDLGF